MSSYDDWKLAEPPEGPRRCGCGHDWEDHGEPVRNLKNQDQDDETEETSDRCQVRGWDCAQFEAADPKDDGDWAFDSWRDEQMERRDEFERSK